MLGLSEIAKRYGGQVLFENISLQINRSDRIGFVGPNGAGKSTLFNIILGHEQPEGGQVLWERGARVGFLPQESAPAGEETVLELVLTEDGEAVWEKEPKAKTILRGLSFREADFEKPLRTFSGGWVMRAHLARLLVQEPDLLLLDEPTNHLDLETLGWFQNYLKYRYSGGIFIISHDRAFLNSLVTGIVELAHRRLHRYSGTYDDYVREKAAREAQQLAAYENQQREINKLQDFVDRFGAKASKAAQAQSKLKQIDRMEKIEAPVAHEKTVAFKFPQPHKSGQRVATMADVHFAYGDLRVYRGLSLEIERGERIVLVGPNGAGKSTLLKLLGQQLTPQSGIITPGLNTKIGYFSQYRSQMFQAGRSVLEEALDVTQRPPEQAARTLLGAFLFRGDTVFKSVDVLSGGEKTRLALAKMLLDPPNFLLMDEPTTHLDVGSIDALIQALSGYTGTLIFISHDVYFIRALAQKVWHISAGDLTPYAGDYQYYLDKTQATSERQALTAGEMLADLRPEEKSNNGASNPARGYKSKEDKRAEAEARQQKSNERKNVKKELETIEQRITQIEARQAEIVQALEDPATHETGGSAASLVAELKKLQTELPILMTQWDVVSEKVLALG
jgi:ATP-binding cassette, subfamily F, member 3